MFSDGLLEFIIAGWLVGKLSNAFGIPLIAYSLGVKIGGIEDILFCGRFFFGFFISFFHVMVSGLQFVILVGMHVAQGQHEKI